MAKEPKLPVTYPDGTARTNAVLIGALRTVLVLGLCGVGWKLASELHAIQAPLGQRGDLILLGFAIVAVIVIALDVFFIPRKSLAAISGLFFGLIVGMVVAYGLSLIINMLFF